MPTAFITGITGQDGSYLAEFLLSRGYDVHGGVRRSSSDGSVRIEGAGREPDNGDGRLFMHDVDLGDPLSLLRILREVSPDEVYNLGGQSHVGLSFDMPEYTAETVGLGTLRLLEALRLSGLPARFYEAGTSEMYGASPPPQDEKTRFNPLSPYAAAKVFAHSVTCQYREAYGLFACNGILFNHESPRRGESFVTRKITRGIAEILAGRQDALYLGNLTARRDWGYARDYVRAMWLMLQQERPDDYVIATGRMHSVQEFAQAAFEAVGLDWREYVRVDERYQRSNDVNVTCGDASKARRELGWEPETSFTQLVRIMLEHDLRESGLDAAALMRPPAAEGAPS
jgi:GDPmannose 4,6-dehydratase